MSMGLSVIRFLKPCHSLGVMMMIGGRSLIGLLTSIGDGR